MPDVTYLLNIIRIVCMCKIILKLLTVAIAVCCFPTNSFSSEWRLHPSFDRNPLRIIDTPEDTYFLVHQQVYHKSINGYDFPSLTLFRYDKNASEKGITPLAHDVQLSSADIRMADYSPRGGYLIIIYNDGGIDLIGRDKELVHIDQLKRFTIPGMSKVTSVSFEPSTGDAWIGTDAGYMHVDAVSFTVQDVKVFDRGIDRICRFGDKLVALSENAAWQSNGINPLTFNEFKKISSVGSPSIMLPLDDNEFAYVYGEPDSNSPISRVLKLARFDNSSWKVADLGQDSFYSLSNNGTVVNRYESNFIPNKDGYLIYSASKAWQLYAPENGESTRLVSISLDSNPISLGSWDFSNFWSYRDRGTFVLRHADFKMDSNVTSATATWTDMQDPIRPNAPAAFICTYMDYSPKYGMLVMNHGHEWELGYNGDVEPPLLSCIKDDKWILKSQAYEIPVSVRDSENLRNVYNNNINKFPLGKPAGLAIDPINTDYIACGSMFGGMMFQDLSNISKDVIKFADKNDLLKDFPYFIDSFQEQTWTDLCCVSTPSFDSNGTLWITYSNAFGTDVSIAKYQIKYLTSQRRHAIYNAAPEELKRLPSWETYYISNVQYPYWNCKTLAARHPNVNNIVISVGGGSSNTVVMIDHKGSLSDTSDDEIKVFDKIIVDNRLEGIIQMNDLVENPNTGEFIISCSSCALVFNPNDQLVDGAMPGKKLNFDGALLQNIQINKIVFDDSGRMWIGTNNQGVVGVSEEHKSVIARYNISNSPLPSDCVYGLGWNPETRSLMISTKLGLAEVFPEVFSSTKELGNPMLSISHIRPDYNGYVEIRNISPNQNIIIKDSNGIEVKRLRNGDFRNIEWDLRNDKGEKVKAGSYKIHISDKTPLELLIMSD